MATMVYDSDLRTLNESELVYKISNRKDVNFNEESIFLVIGTSMQTAFANTLVGIAEKCGMKIHFINENAEEEVPKFIKEHIFLPRKKAE